MTTTALSSWDRLVDLRRAGLAAAQARLAALHQAAFAAAPAAAVHYRIRLDEAQRDVEAREAGLGFALTGQAEAARSYDATVDGCPSCLDAGCWACKP